MSHRDKYKEGVPRVSEILARDYEYYNKDPYYLKRGNWGHAISHAIAEGEPESIQRALILDTLTEIKCNQPDWDVSDWPGIALAYRSWLSEQRDAELIAIEQYVYDCIDTFQGTYDQKWRLRTPSGLIETVRLDIKVVTTGRCPEVTRLQLAAYDIADQLRTARLGLALHPDGTFQESWYIERKHYRDYDVFRGMVRHWWMHGPQSKEYR